MLPYDIPIIFIKEIKAYFNEFLQDAVMKPLEQSVLDIINQHGLIPDESAVLVAVSGGPDSTALLSILVNIIPASIKAAVYIDHKLRPEETEAEISHVKKLCDSFNIKFDCCSVDVQNVRVSSGESPEACARRLRFEALDKMAVLHETDLIALGHTSDDQVEEVLIRLIRGSGMNGLSGMSVRNKPLIRPLLHNSKEEILQYLATVKLPFCKDSSNKSQAFLRNKVRLYLVPLLEHEFNPSIKQTILNSAAILRDEDDYLNRVTEKTYPAIVTEKEQGIASHRERCYRLEAFGQIPAALRRRILEKMFWQSSCPPSFQAIEEIMKLTQQGRTGTTIHFSGGLRVIRTGEEIIFSSRPRDKNMRHRHDDRFSQKIIIEGVGEYEVSQLGRTLCIEESDQLDISDSGVQCIDRAKSIFPLTLRAPLPGELFHPIGAPGKKKISRFLSDRKVPKHQRHCYPVLVSQQGVIIAIPGITISESVKISEETSMVLKIFWKQEPQV